MDIKDQVRYELQTLDCGHKKYLESRKDKVDLDVFDRMYDDMCLRSQKYLNISSRKECHRNLKTILRKINDNYLTIPDENRSYLTNVYEMMPWLVLNMAHHYSLVQDISQQMIYQLETIYHIIIIADYDAKIRSCFYEYTYDLLHIDDIYMIKKQRVQRSIEMKNDESLRQSQQHHFSLYKPMLLEPKVISSVSDDTYHYTVSPTYYDESMLAPMADTSTADISKINDTNSIKYKFNTQLFDLYRDFDMLDFGYDYYENFLYISTCGMIESIDERRRKSYYFKKYKQKLKFEVADYMTLCLYEEMKDVEYFYLPTLIDDQAALKYHVDHLNPIFSLAKSTLCFYDEHDIPDDYVDKLFNDINKLHKDGMIIAYDDIVKVLERKDKSLLDDYEDKHYALSLMTEAYSVKKGKTKTGFIFHRVQSMHEEVCSRVGMKYDYSYEKEVQKKINADIKEVSKQDISEYEAMIFDYLAEKYEKGEKVL